MEAPQTLQSQFLIRLTSLPVVSSTFDLATSTYGRVKHMNPLLDYTLTTAENSVLYANDKAKPLVKKFERQITLADGLACKGLEKLEEKVPLITKPTEVILEDTRALYNTTIKMGVDQYEHVKTLGFNKVQAVKKYGLDTAQFGLDTANGLTSQYTEMVTQSVNGALALTENCLEHYLPALDDDEKFEDPKKGQFLTARVANLSNKIQRRVYRHAIHRAHHLKATAETSLGKYTSPEVVQSTRDNLTAAYANAAWLWEQLNVDPQSEASEEDTMSKKALHQARSTTRHVVSVFVTAKTTVQDIPTRFNHGVATAYTFSSNAYNTAYDSLQKMNAQDLPGQVSSAVVHFKDSLKLEQRMTLIVHGITRTAALQWLVHNVLRYQLSEQVDEESSEEDAVEE